MIFTICYWKKFRHFFLQIKGIYKVVLGVFFFDYDVISMQIVKIGFDFSHRNSPENNKFGRHFPTLELRYANKHFVIKHLGIILVSFSWSFFNILRYCISILSPFFTNTANHILLTNQSNFRKNIRLLKQTCTFES